MARVIPAPGWVLAALSPQPPPTRLNGFLFDDGWQGFNSFDWLRAHANWSDVLDRHDWQVHSVSGGDVYYTRPGKAVRDGKSAVLHDGGPLVVFSTEVPETLEGLGHPTADGTGFSVSIVEFICAYEFNGEMATMGRAIAQRYGPVAVAPGAGGGRATATDDDDTPGDDTSPMFPEQGFYEQRLWMAACRQMAEAVGGSPAAHLLAYLCRWATLIPPGYSIPPINGAASSFDLLCVIAGTSGSGKTSPMRNAARMLPVQRKDLRMGLGIGSGEGIIESFYGKRELEGENGRKTERAKIIAGVNFSVSEGLIFSDLAERGGTTHVTRLCDAWSGAPLSTANATQDTFRHIDEDQYRLTLMMGIQADQAHRLITDDATSQGFVGRLLFAWAEEPRVSPRPAPPDLFVLQPPPEIAIPATAEHPKWYQPTYLTYPQAIITEIQEASDRRVGKSVPVEEHHHDLMRCKVAGIVALMDGRLTVSADDWAIATTLVDCSRAVRLHLRAIRRWTESDRRHHKAEQAGEFKYVAAKAVERRAVTDYKSKVLTRLRTEGPLPYGTDDGLGKMTSSKRRWMIEQAVNELVAEGSIRKHGDRYELA